MTSTSPHTMSFKTVPLKTMSLKLDNFFTLFDIPVDFDVDNLLLEQRMRDLQQRYHPDNMTASEHTAADSDMTADKHQNSALINHAYQTLRYPDTRASYMLQMQGQDAELNNSISDLDFLESAMALRIELDETQSAETLASLVATVYSKIDRYAEQFKMAFADKHWQQAIDTTQKLKFLVKLVKDINNKIDSLCATHDDEDDLYI